MLRKIIRACSRAEDLAVTLLCLFVCLLGTYGLYDSYCVYRQANDESLLRFKPDYEGEQTDEKTIVGNMVAWLSIDDTEIDYPVMQGDDNDEYLQTDPYGEYSLAGSIFLDYRNSSDFTDDYSLIYGHHMEGGSMFGNLDHFTDEKYFKAHRTGEIYLNDVPYTLTFFAVLDSADATREELFSPTECGRQQVLDYIKEQASIYLQPEEMEQDKIVALSTCKYPDTVDRTVVVGMLHLSDG